MSRSDEPATDTEVAEAEVEPDEVEPDQVDADRSARVVETHTATVFFVDDRVYKLKKPVDLGFLDFSTRQAREQACHDEVRLNRRLAPDAYLGVLDVTGPDGQPLDHLVAMRRMPDERRLTRCIERGEDVDGALRTIAHAVATLHEGSTPQPRQDAQATEDAVRRRWVEGFEQLRPLAHLVPDPERLDRTERLVLAYLDGRSALFDQRIADGWIRDGHGDLQAEDIFLLPEGPQILDCIEFGDDYRWGDVLADVAFLAMDLERLGRGDLAERFLQWHDEFTGDRWPASLGHHYVAYRAHVRAKVGVLRHVQRNEPIGPGVGHLIDLSLEQLEAGQVRLVVVGGLPGTGKSTVAKAVADQLGAVVLRSDEVRQRMGQGADRYAPAAVEATYQQVLDDARRLLSLGESVVLDATWQHAGHRRLARDLAATTSSRTHELRCTLPASEAAARIERRRQLGEDASEATPVVARDMAASFDPWPEAVAVSTEPAPEAVADAALASILGA